MNYSPRFAALAVALLSVTSALAQKSGGDASLPSLILDSLKVNFAPISSIAYEINEGSDSLPVEQRIRLIEQGEKYLFEVRYINRLKGQDFTLHSSYDGQRAYKLSMAPRHLFTREKPFTDFDEFARGVRGPLMLFEFLNIGSKRFSLHAIKEELSNPNWVDRITVVSSMDKQLLGQECIAIKVRDGYDRIDDRRVDFLVFLSKRSLSPLGWETYSRETGNRLTTYTVEKMRTIAIAGTAYSFSYPETAGLTAEEFRGGAGEIISFPSVNINQLDEGAFAFDFSSVDKIEDLDNDTLIMVPK